MLGKPIGVATMVAPGLPFTLETRYDVMGVTWKEYVVPSVKPETVKLVSGVDVVAVTQLEAVNTLY